MDSSGGCPLHFNSCGESLQSKLDSPMPWVGMYIAAASALVTIAMAADVFYSFKNKKYWLPSKFVSMNAFSLTILAISMKLPVDLTNQMLRSNEILARVSSLALMSTVMGNLMASLGAMELNEIMLNLASIGTLVITIVVNVSIHISRMLDNVRKDFRSAVRSEIYAEQIMCTVIMFILFLMMCYWSVALPILKRVVYDKEYHRLNEETSTKQVKWGDFTIDELREMLRNYWMNARIGNPQFFIARSDICAASGAMCLLTALTLLKAWIRMHFVYKEGVSIAASNYKWSINWILIIQTIGVGLGTIAPVFRWFVAAKLNSSIINHWWDVTFVPHASGALAFTRWVRAPLSLNIPYPKFRHFFKIAKVIFSIFCIIALIPIVLASNLLLLVSAACVRVILLCFPHDESIEEINKALMLFDVTKLYRDSAESIRNEVNKLIEMGRKKQPKDLIKLLHKSVNFNGLKEFVNKPILRPCDGLNCWSLSIVILTSIAVQLPNITTDKIDELKRGVTEGLLFVKLIERSFNANLEIYKFRLRAEELWSEVQLFGHSVSINIKRQSYRETLQALAERSDSSGETDLEDYAWESINGIASISADHICSAIIKSNKENDGETEEDLFERLSIMISDIISACLTNLTPLITFRCSDSAVKDREKNVCKAAIILGETEVILEMLRKRKLPGLDPNKAAHLNEWRVFMEQNPNWMASTEQDIEPELD